jgi:ABC-2 family transporter protein
MIRLTWRQFRTQSALAAVVLVALALLLAITGPTLVDRFHSSGAALCAATGHCSATAGLFTNNFQWLQIIVNAAVYVVPALIGMFWGAPLVAREFETGTYRLAWTQGVSRTRWLVAKLAFVGLASMVAAGLLALMATWWSSPIDTMFQNRMTPSVFGERGIAPMAYAVMAFALGVAAGIVIRRTVAAMAAVLAGFVALRLALTYWVRPHILTPVTKSFSGQVGIGSVTVQAGTTGPPIGSWVLSDETVNRAGRVLGPNGGQVAQVTRGNSHQVVIPGAGSCHVTQAPRVLGGPSGPGPNQIAACAQHLGIHQVSTYFPPSDYWPLQGVETAICLALAVAFGALSVWWIRHRVA